MTEDDLPRAQEALRVRIITDARKIVKAMSSGPEAPTIAELVEVAVGYVEGIVADFEESCGPGIGINITRNAAAHADVMLRDELATVASFSAIIMAISRYRPVRR